MQVEAKVINVLCNGAGIGGVLNPISCPSHELTGRALVVGTFRLHSTTLPACVVLHPRSMLQLADC